jgi:catechol 2,3-dioxygenase-like lactoylglutathione lyase family enzyme
MHVGVLIGDLDRALAFYRDTLGFVETWRGSRDPKQLDWVNLRVPDGDTYIEFMLYDRKPAPTARGSAHHLCLEVPDMAKAKEWIESRPGRAAYSRPLEIRTGINRRRQLNLFDPDGTRSELMEPVTVDGQPAPSSAAPAPIVFPDWAGAWTGTLVNHPALPGAARVEVTREIGPWPSGANPCAPFKTTYRENGEVKGTKDYRFCAGAKPGEFYVDEGNGIRLESSWLGGALVSMFRLQNSLVTTTLRVHEGVMVEEIVSHSDSARADGVQPLPARHLQRLTLRRAPP